VDYDTFSELGGTPHFQKALAVVNNAQQANRPGWQPLSSNRSRNWIVENYNNGQMVEMRKGYYAYHRLALDTFEAVSVVLQGCARSRRHRRSTASEAEIVRLS
jgi:hypothetical protein